MPLAPSRVAIGGAAVIALLAMTHPIAAQSDSASVALVRRAVTSSPRIRAADAQAEALRERIAPAGAWPDPMLMAGIQNQPLSSSPSAAMSAGPEPMTMRMLGVSQTIPYPGKTTLRTRAARAEADAGDARRNEVTRELRRDVLNAYYDAVAARMLARLLDREQRVAASVLPATEARYVAGTATQVDLLKARTQLAMLLADRNSAAGDEASAMAQLQAAVGDTVSTSLLPDSIDVRNVIARPLPSLDSLIAAAIHTNPRLAERRAMLAAQDANASLSARDSRPDVDVTVAYGQRIGLPDMFTATVSIPLALQRGRKQHAAARAAQLDATAATSDRGAEEIAVRADVTRAHAATSAALANLDLLGGTILPQSRATFESASASWSSGRGDLLGVLDAMRALFATERLYVRTVQEYENASNELRALVGEEVLP